jgi:serine/threonine protein kinase
MNLTKTKFKPFMHAAGQFGKIFKGVYKRSEGEGLPVAIKTIKKYESEKERKSFQKEMTVMSKLIHPNIVRLFGLIKQGKLIILSFCDHELMF